MKCPHGKIRRHFCTECLTEENYDLKQKLVNLAGHAMAAGLTNTQGWLDGLAERIKAALDLVEPQ